MDKIIELAKEIRNEINELPEIKEYLKLKTLLENDKELAELRGNIARLASEHKEEERKNLIEIYNSHPIVNNYNLAKEEAYKTLSEIKNVLSDK